MEAGSPDRVLPAGPPPGRSRSGASRGGWQMIGPKMEEALNRHVQLEVSSAYLYLGLSAWCEAKAWKGFARWLRVQSDEELEHAKKSLDYLLARGGDAKLAAIEAPPSS